MMGIVDRVDLPTEICRSSVLELDKEKHVYIMVACILILFLRYLHEVSQWNWGD